MAASLLSSSSIYTHLPTSKESFFAPSYAYAYYRQKKVDLLTMRTFSSYPEEIQERLGMFHFRNNYPTPIIFHLCYPDPASDLLGIEFHYQKVSCSQPSPLPSISEEFELTPSFQIPYPRYQQIFSRLYDHLLDGNAYQMNLTFPFLYKFKTASSLLEKFLHIPPSSLGAYAHLSSIPELDLLLLSNSPECLFEIDCHHDHFTLTTRPIKGTIELNSSSDFDTQWKKLFLGAKDRGELFMITDLLRNDLSRIGKARAKVLSLQRPMVAPGILHQYSLLSVDLPYSTNLGEIVRALFPGGSITGAPKVAAMNLLQELEIAPRNFYTGTTILLYKRRFKASIYIRTAQVDTKKRELSYGSGGGVTLLSESASEYQEMVIKTKSFIDLLKV